MYQLIPTTEFTGTSPTNNTTTVFGELAKCKDTKQMRKQFCRAASMLAPSQLAFINTYSNRDRLCNALGPDVSVYLENKLNVDFPKMEFFVEFRSRKENDPFDGNVLSAAIDPKDETGPTVAYDTSNHGVCSGPAGDLDDTTQAGAGGSIRNGWSLMLQQTLH